MIFSYVMMHTCMYFHGENLIFWITCYTQTSSANTHYNDMVRIKLGTLTQELKIVLNISYMYQKNVQWMLKMWPSSYPHDWLLPLVDQEIQTIKMAVKKGEEMTMLLAIMEERNQWRDYGDMRGRWLSLLRNLKMGWCAFDWVDILLIKWDDNTENWNTTQGNNNMWWGIRINTTYKRTQISRGSTIWQYGK